MPELPEVETIKNDLLQYLKLGYPIENVQLTDKDFFIKHSNFTDKKLIEKHKVKEILRYGKVLIFKLDNGYLGFHLGMSGQIVNDLKNTKYPRHTRFSFIINDKPVYFIDVRKFGWIKFCKNKKELIPKGIDPMTENFTFKYFKEKCLNNKRPIKALLLDQNLIAGIGNIYDCEILFKAGIHPNVSANSISLHAGEKLYHSIIEVLKEGIENYGTTFSMYQNMMGEKGQHQHY